MSAAPRPLAGTPREAPSAPDAGRPARRAGLRLGIDASNLGFGGARTHITEMLGAADPAAHGIERVTVWGPAAVVAALPPRPWLDPIPVAALDASRLNRIGWQRRLTAELRRSSDVLFVPGQVYLGAFRPYITMSRNLLVFDAAERRAFGWSSVRLRLHLLEHTQRRTMRRADGVIFLTHHARDIVEGRTGPLPGRIGVVSHGVGASFRHPPRPQAPLHGFSAERPFRWVYVSPIDLHKHHDRVATAAAALRDEGFPITVDFVGPGYPRALKPLRRLLARLDPDGACIRVAGGVPYERLPELHRQADAFVFASSCESLPNTLLEAMAAGLPVACSHRSVMPEVLGDAGLTFDPRDARSIADAMRRLMTDADERARLARRAYDRALEFSWERCADETLAFIAAVARGHRRGA